MPAPTHLHAAFEQAIRTGTLAEAQATLAALFERAGDQAGMTWATSSAEPCPAAAKSA